MEDRKILVIQYAAQVVANNNNFKSAKDVAALIEVFSSFLEIPGPVDAGKGSEKITPARSASVNSQNGNERSLKIVNPANLLPFGNIKLSSKVIDQLNAANISTIADLTSHTRKELLIFVRRKGYDEIHKALKGIGLAVKEIPVKVQAVPIPDGKFPS